jgi:glycerophosphoryl diester phosphodiesterase
MTSSLYSPRLASRPEVHGHRGCRGLLPENTLPAFLHAIALGVDVLELDVVISADEQVVVSHEPWLNPQLGRGPKGELIDSHHESAYNLYQLPYTTIRQCTVGEWPHPLFPTQQLRPSYRPLLREVLQATEAACHELGRPPVGYSIELKSTLVGDNIFHPLPTRFVELVLGELTLASAAVRVRTTLLSFDARVLQAARQLAPTQPLCLLHEGSGTASALFEQLGFIPHVYGPDFHLLSLPLVHALRAAYPSLRLVPWTVNELQDLHEVIEWGVDGITTDFPDCLLKLLGQ